MLARSMRTKDGIEIWREDEDHLMQDTGTRCTSAGTRLQGQLREVGSHGVAVVYYDVVTFPLNMELM